MIYQYEILGGILLGIGLCIPLLAEGRVSGVSGYATNILRPSSDEGRVGFIFVAGMVLGGLIWKWFGGWMPSGNEQTGDIELWILAGLLVGVGSRLGGGCTSGHGICGLGRISVRSLVSVVIFMVVAMMVSYWVGVNL